MAESLAEKRRNQRQEAIRNKIQANIERAKEEQRQEQLKRRIEVAKTGLAQYNSKKYGEAAKAFLTYIRILEDWKGVPENGLAPKQFDLKKDIAELLLINAVFWHLVKLFDNTPPGKDKRFIQYLGKYVVFSKGMQFQPLAAETLRKYIDSTSAKHRAQMKAAYKAITGTNCFVASSLMDCYEGYDPVPVLRIYRDEKLSKTFLGGLFVKTYYRLGPLIAEIMDHMPYFVRRYFAKQILDFAKKLESELS